jgi:membrane associated rhomboid family serine protease
MDSTLPNPSVPAVPIHPDPASAPVPAPAPEPAHGDDARAWWEALGEAGALPASGFVDGGKLVPLTREKLVRRLREGKTPTLVWTREHPALVHPWEVPYLFEAMRKAVSEPGLVRLLLAALLLMPNLPALLANPLETLGGPAAVLVFICGLMAWSGARTMREARRLTPEGMSAALETAKAEAAEAAEAEAEAPTGTWDRHTRAIAAVLLAVGAAQMLAPETSIAAAGLVKDAVREGEAWRMLTAALLHGGVLHFCFNLGALFSLGPAIERWAHRWWLPVVFVAAALAGNAVSMVALPNGTSVGASGGLLGIFGFLLVLGWRRKETMPEGFSRGLLWNLAIIGAMGVVGWNYIDNGAHAGGLLMGAFLGFLAIPSPARVPQWKPGRAVRIAGIVSLALLAASALFIFHQMARAGLPLNGRG